MKYLIFVFIVLCSLNLSAQTIPNSFVSMATISDLRSAIPQSNEVVTLLGLPSPTDGNGANYIWISTSTATDDGYNFIAVTGISTGRWTRMNNGATMNSSISRPINSTSFTISTVKTATVFYNISISCTATIGAASSGSVALQYSINGGTTWVTESTIANSNTVSLAVALNSVNLQSTVLCGVIPAGALVRMVSTSTGTTTITYLTGIEYY
jgi:hypothetical protein